jgi:hypothetical protein
MTKVIIDYDGVISIDPSYFPTLQAAMASPTSPLKVVIDYDRHPDHLDSEQMAYVPFDQISPVPTELLVGKRIEKVETLNGRLLLTLVDAPPPGLPDDQIISGRALWRRYGAWLVFIGCWLVLILGVWLWLTLTRQGGVLESPGR